MKKIKAKEKKTLLFSITHKDFELEFFPCGTKGGQSANRDHSGCRIKHTASGAIGEGREFKSQGANREAAFNRLVQTEKFQNYLKLECSRRFLNYQSIEDMINKLVDKQMDLSNIKLEVQDNKGRWIEISWPDFDLMALEAK